MSVRFLAGEYKLSDKKVKKDIIIILLVCAIAAGLLVWFKTKDKPILGGDYYTSATDSITRLASASTTILSANTGRVFARCTSFSTVRIDVHFGATASRNWGFPLYASGSFQIDQSNPFNGIVTGTIPSDTASTSAYIHCVEK